MNMAIITTVSSHVREPHGMVGDRHRRRFLSMSSFATGVRVNGDRIYVVVRFANLYREIIGVEHPLTMPPRFVGEAFFVRSYP